MRIVDSFRPIMIIIFMIFLGSGLALVLPFLADLQGKAAQSRTTPGDESAPEAAAVYHVAKTGNGSTGLDWTNAFTNPQAALNIAISGDEIWVATGVYTPGINEDDSFALVNGVAMYGGFAGTELLKSERDWEVNLTILSGDIEGDDTNLNGVVRTTDHIVGDNSFHVITATGVVSDTILDGFTITAGQANGGGGDHDYGGGFYCDGEGTGNVCSPSLKNLTFSGNLANSDGGAINFNGSSGGRSSPNLVGAIFSGNSSIDGVGGAINMSGSQERISNPYFANILLLGNSAADGGAVAIDSHSNPSFINAVFSGNSAVFDGGAIYINSDENNIIFTNITMSSNRAQTSGGAVHTGSRNLELRNSILWNNEVNGVVGTITTTINKFNGIVTVTNSLVQGAGASGAGWISDPNFVDGGGNIHQDPLFVTQVDPAVAPTTAGDLHLQENSPARDAGDNTFVTVPTDPDGSPRIVNLIVDMGAFEFQLEHLFSVYQPLIIK